MMKYNILCFHAISTFSYNYRKKKKKRKRKKSVAENGDRSNIMRNTPLIEKSKNAFSIFFEKAIQWFPSLNLPASQGDGKLGDTQLCNFKWNPLFLYQDVDFLKKESASLIYCSYYFNFKFRHNWVKKKKKLRMFWKWKYLKQ